MFLVLPKYSVNLHRWIAANRIIRKLGFSVSQKPGFCEKPGFFTLEKKPSLLYSQFFQFALVQR